MNLQFLRPYSVQPVLSRSSIYTSFHAVTRQQTWGTRRTYVTDDDNNVPHDTEEGHHPFEVISTEVKKRIDNLKKRNALSYPRLGDPQLKKYKYRFEAIQTREFNKRFPRNLVWVERPPERWGCIVRGRVTSVRKAGPHLIFMDIEDESCSVQASVNLNEMLKFDGEEGGVKISDFGYTDVASRFVNFAAVVRRGDIISVTGIPTRNPKKPGETALQAVDFPTILTPSIAPLPQTKQESAQDRHIHLLTSPKASSYLIERSRITNSIRQFLLAQDFVEVPTPILAADAGGAIATPFLTRHTGSSDLTLRIAPELWLKRLVVGGLNRVFELGPAFRNEGIDLTHNPEFTMCEFYMAYANLDSLLSMTQDMLREVANRVQSVGPAWPFLDADPWPRVEFVPALEEATGLSLADIRLEDPGAFDRLTASVKTKADVLARLQSHCGLVDPADARDLPKLLDHLAAAYLEGLHKVDPFFIMHQPACMSPLSKSFVCPETGVRVAARAELFFKGKELANMYEEENDPFAQREKLVAQIQLNEEAGGEKNNNAELIDEQYIETLLTGLPPTGGWGAGIERIVMALTGAERINDVLSFGSLKNVIGMRARSRELSRIYAQSKKSRKMKEAKGMKGE